MQAAIIGFQGWSFVGGRGAKGSPRIVIRMPTYGTVWMSKCRFPRADRRCCQLRLDNSLSRLSLRTNNDRAVSLISHRVIY